MSQEPHKPTKTSARLIHAQIAKATVLLTRRGRVKVMGDDFTSGTMYVFDDSWNDDRVARVVNEQVTEQPNGRPLSKPMDAADVADLRREHFGMTMAERDEQEVAAAKRGGNAALIETVIKMQRALDDLTRRVDKIDGQGQNRLPLNAPNGKEPTR